MKINNKQKEVIHNLVDKVFRSLGPKARTEAIKHINEQRHGRIGYADGVLTNELMGDFSYRVHVHTNHIDKHDKIKSNVGYQTTYLFCAENPVMGIMKEEIHRQNNFIGNGLSAKQNAVIQLSEHLIQMLEMTIPVSRDSYNAFQMFDKCEGLVCEIRNHDYTSHYEYRRNSDKWVVPVETCERTFKALWDLNLELRRLANIIFQTGPAPKIKEAV